MPACVLQRSMEETERVRFLAMDSAVVGLAAVPAVGRTDAASLSLQERLVELMQRVAMLQNQRKARWRSVSL